MANLMKCYKIQKSKYLLHIPLILGIDQCIEKEYIHLWEGMLRQESIDKDRDEEARRREWKDDRKYICSLKNKINKYK